MLAETVWVLATVYERDASAIARTIDTLLKHKDLTLLGTFDRDLAQLEGVTRL